MSAEIIDLAVFRARCNAAVGRYVCGRQCFHDAVDGMQAGADVTGLTWKVGQDLVQSIMVDAIRPVREAEWMPAGGSPQFHYGPTMFEIEAAALRNRGVLQSVLDAADHVRRQGDPDKLRQWLDQHSEYISAIMEHFRHA